jgi:hypothetical protein
VDSASKECPPGSDIVHLVAMRSLLHAQKHGDVSFSALLVGALPRKLKWPYAKWFAGYSPILITARDGKVEGKLRKKDSHNHQGFELDAARSDIPVQSPGSLAALKIDWRELPLGKCIREMTIWFSGASDPNRRETSRAGLEQLLSNIPRRSDEDLTEMYSESVAILTGIASGRQNDAVALRSAILHEWGNRNQQAENNEHFKWRAIRTPAGLERIGVISSPSEGMLSAFGYHVGQVKGRAQRFRWFLLDDIFTSVLLPINGPDYMRKWGHPNSATRLKQLNLTLAMLGTNERGRGLELAPSQRESDLEYLYKKYYADKFRFTWTML